ncbi:MFS transporter [Mesorhizobium amorphae]|uniref:MFS transporter n=1 Tax=Mesorhizobium amorphae TaxID=71433 RepID=UPI003F4FB834
MLWLATLSVPLGGFLTDGTKRGGAVLATACAGFAFLMLLLSRSGPVVALIIAMGIVCGLPAGAIMSLPMRVLNQKTRSIGMGVFYAVYYAGMLAGPAIGGKLATWAGTATAALDFGAAALLLCPLLLWSFHRIRRLRSRSQFHPARWLVVLRHAVSREVLCLFRPCRPPLGKRIYHVADQDLSQRGRKFRILEGS